MKATIVPVPPAETVPPLDEIRTRVRHDMLPDGYDHVVRVAEIARELAEIHGVDPDRAEAAALIHDIADRYSEKDLVHRAEGYGLEFNLTEARVPKLIHGKVGAEILRREWMITDEEVLDAVRCHTSGSTRMSTLAKVVFVADKIEPDRDKFYGGLDDIRAIAREDLDQAILKLYAWRMSELIQHGAPVHEDLADARNALIEENRAGARD
jgi:predicted HD superfamily hydrolase involved in NAD metabolism